MHVHLLKDSHCCSLIENPQLFIKLVFNKFDYFTIATIAIQLTKASNLL
jgi:hypothetical protein